MKIKEMTTNELKEAIIFMTEQPIADENFSNWNFDSETWQLKFLELINEVFSRGVK